MRTITINPLTRISGFLEIEVMVENHKVIDAKSSGLLFRGFEKMLKGRHPLDAIYFTERICGICSTAHSMASALALEDALKIVPNENDKMIRDFLHGCEFLQNHLRHFYLYTLPDFIKGPNVEPVYNNSHTDFRLRKNLNDRLANSYVEAVKYSRKAHEALAVLGGKAPHNHGIFVGGVTVNLDASKYSQIKALIYEIDDFVTNRMLEDVQIIAEYYSDYFNNGAGYGNLLSYGVYDDYSEVQLTYVKPKVSVNNNFYKLNENRITEDIKRAWYSEDTNPSIPKEGAYTWVKAPRYNGYAFEVGPLARMILSSNYPKKVSTMDRTIARVLEAKKIIEIMKELLRRIKFQPAEQKRYDILDSTTGRGLTDTTRGALGHWISIKDKRIEHYNIITPSVWNCSPTDSNGVKGTIEQALIGTEIIDEEHPVEIGRIVRSFDPCISCATHVITGTTKPIQIIV
ncbi:nickel-dependent hydrogenase large subunit [Clostridium swellfunianum]|uniref:nickel-dependent hydrogenase large subunit n=1 Tax=Clostridium swellfunianum TaxID=1367462 RepID=UPI00202E6708|nr:nickel-dependent hydrogenase large subunit [Clostridium swellfunianum]MCM0650700.1 nickel-dependent hydrogenase large subunit [Clostridium swellfunianum]